MQDKYCQMHRPDSMYMLKDFRIMYVKKLAANYSTYICCILHCTLMASAVFTKADCRTTVTKKYSQNCN